MRDPCCRRADAPGQGDPYAAALSLGRVAHIRVPRGGCRRRSPGERRSGGAVVCGLREPAGHGRQFTDRLQRRVQHVHPFAAGALPGAGQTVLYTEGPVPQLDTVQVDSSHGPDFLHAETQPAKYRAHLDWMAHIALSSKASRDFIHAIADEL
ncbi:Scr1 family TA system antitoxin-like transcriptional regulator [Streptomyces olivaceus]|uniref:Scr1 family TA system antitoxin-like transcriptional regulator n=1 Tax=Streptomyces olivaceus TaxID=47716 RepID=UPI0037F9A7BE